MSELLLELYSEEIPPQLQISARKKLKENIENSLKEENLKNTKITAYSTPTRLSIIIKNIPEFIKISGKEIRGPKVGVIEDILNNFLRSHEANKKDIFEKATDKGNFFFIKTLAKEIPAKDLLTKIILNSIASISWRKSMRWSNNTLLWGRPLRSILAIFKKKIYLRNKKK